MRIGLREVVFTVLLAAIPATAWWFVFRPNNERNRLMLEQIETKRRKLEKLNCATARIGGLKKEIEELEKAVQVLYSRLPSEKEIDKVLRETWLLAQANDLRTSSIQTLKGRKDRIFTDSTSKFSEQPVAVEVRGNFLGFYRFLQELERQPRIMRIHRITIKKPKDAMQGDIEANFVMSIFFEREHCTEVASCR